MNVRFPTGSSTNDSLGKIPIGSNPTNQTIKIENFPLNQRSPDCVKEFFHEVRLHVFFL